MLLSIEQLVETEKELPKRIISQINENRDNFKSFVKT